MGGKENEGIALRAYQKQAIRAWEENGYCGLFEMATGTGKTFTALSCAKVLLENQGRLTLLILVPILPLSVQWRSDVKGQLRLSKVILANSQNKEWYKEALFQLSLPIEGNSFCIIATYATFLTYRFQDVLAKLDEDTFLIADEVHNFGTSKHIEKYPKHISRRLGLSATPNRYFDEDGTTSVFDFFKAIDKPTFQFGMAEAIENGYLSEYYYYPRIVSLNEEELDEYKAISLKLLKYFQKEGGLKEESSVVTSLLLKRKRIIHKAANKLEVFREIMGELIKSGKEINHLLVYVPEGRDLTIDDEDSRLINTYSQIISNEFKLTQHQFIGVTAERQNVLKQFSEGRIAVLTAMKCLDEGVNIKRAETAIFCSSTGNPRQFIQRRGRLLRTHPKKKFAIIYDLIVVPEITNQYFEDSLWMERSLLQNELRRVHEFAGLALNQYQALKVLEDKALEFDLDIYSKPSF